MSINRIIYLLLAIAGATLTWYFNIRFMQSHPGVFDIAAFISGGLANPAAGSLTMDITIACLTGFVWMIIEARRIGMKHAWIYIILGCTVAFAFAFPLFLFMREPLIAEGKKTT